MLKLEMAQVRFHSGLDMLYTVHEAMAEHPDKQTAYSKALYAVYDYLKMVEGEFADYIERTTAAARRR